MAFITSRINYLKASAKKLRPFAQALKGKKIDEAEWIIKNSGLGHAPEFWHALTNALAMAKSKGETVADASVAQIAICDGPRLKRFRPVARGRSAGYRHSLSHLTLTIQTDATITAKKPRPSRNIKEQNGS